MSNSLVFTFIAADKPGLVERLAYTVSQYGGNWLESRMSQLAGQFAGIVQIEVNAQQRAQLREALLDLAGIGLTIVVAADVQTQIAADQRHLRLSIIGNDRPGIVLEVASALARRHINVLEMDTSITSAPMTAEPLFEAIAEIEVPQTLDLLELNRQLDEIAEALTVDIALEESLR
ncbi:MAG TPA: ACT domain-containing protein [Spongiibacteraceae bacterium]